MSTAANSLRSCKKETAVEMAEVCSIHLGDGLYGLPISHILEIVGDTKPETVPLAPAFVGGLVHYRGDVLTTVNARQLLGMPPLEGKVPDLLVVESANGCFGLIVDSVREVLTVSQEDFEPNPSTIHERSKAFFAGTYKLKDRLMVMLDPARIDPLELARAN
ncbi:chemotaxis protein CheW [Terracidiphilus gabretensis]|jgi:purine-binding chemotaxis protein CheW|uniref:chemotaxis protein CheW n=1 Tax=Terracidiphilus gabretensis TaxID=1577687 RepID=UPI00071C1D36|nr:chemotaxis protein CheW [Terracidiphilus gabretensis]